MSNKNHINLKYKHCESANDLLKNIASFGEYFGKNPDQKWIFRGLSDSDDKLIPTLFRNNVSKIKKYLHTETEKIYGNTYNIEDNIKNLIDIRAPNHKNKDAVINYVCYRIFELHLTEIFVNNCNEATLPIFETPPDYEKKILYKISEFPEITESLVQNFPDEEILKHHLRPETLALARHHGIPTSWLDWSENPFVAAFFASQKRKNSKAISIWAMEISDHIKKESHYDSIFKFHSKIPKHGLEYFSKQQGIFTEMTRFHKHYIYGGKPDLLSYLEERDKPEETPMQIIQFTLPTSEVNNLIKQLTHFGFCLHTLQPTYDNDAKSAKPDF